MMQEPMRTVAICARGLRRTGRTCSAGALTALALAVVPAAADATTITKTVTAGADSEVRSGKPNQNFGTGSTLAVDQDPMSESYLKFDVAGVSGTVSSARLRLRITDATKNGPYVRSTGSAWAETSLTYGNRPAATSPALDNRAAVSAGAWVEYDVTRAVSGDGAYSFALTADSKDGMDFAARENATYPPQLRITYDDGSTPAPAPTPAPDTSAPTAAVLQPASGAVYTTAGTQNIQVDVRDDVAVTKVEFMDNGRVVATQSGAPYGYAWSFSAADNGAHSWTVRATDAAGNATSSAPVDVSVDIPAPAPSPAPAPTGTTYYLDAVGGSDTNSGTSAQSAWKTLSKATAATLSPGDTLLLNRGQSWTGTLTMAESGSAAAPVTVAAYGTGSAPSISGASTCITLSGSYIRLADLQIGGCSWAGVEIRGAGNLVERNLITGNAAGVDVKAGATSNRVLNNEIKDNNRMSVLTSTPTDDDSGAFGVLLKGDGTEVAYNTISGSDAFSYDYGRDGAAVEIYGAQGSNIHHNAARDNDAFSELGNSRSADNLYAYNVVTSSLATSVFLVTRGAQSSWGPVLRTTLENNTVRLTGSSSQGVVCHAGCSTDILRMRNNIVGAVAKAIYADARPDEDTSVFFAGPVQTTMGPNSRIADPQFVDAAGGNLRLSASSPAVDRGVAVGQSKDLDGVAVPLDGNGDGVSLPDIGAYERH